MAVVKWKWSLRLDMKLASANSRLVDQIPRMESMCWSRVTSKKMMYFVV